MAAEAGAHRLPSPRAHRISVPLGSRLTMLSLGRGAELLGCNWRGTEHAPLWPPPPPPPAPGHVLPCLCRSSRRPARGVAVLRAGQECMRV